MYSNETQMVGSLFVLALFILYWVIPAIVCAVSANRRGLSWIWFGLFALLFTPIIGFLAVIAFPPKIDAEIVIPN